MNYQAVLFLDIDGVLNDHRFSEAAQSCTLKASCVEAFNLILTEAQPRVVISSAWRYMVFRGVMTWPGFCYMLRTHGVHRHISSFLMGCTGPDEEAPSRGEQIAEWVQKSTTFPVDHFVVLDDVPEGMSMGPVQEHLIQTDGRVGLTMAQARRVIARLKGLSDPILQECPGHERGGLGPACCDRAGEYNGFGSDGPRLFTCPKGCSCHD